MKRAAVGFAALAAAAGFAAGYLGAPAREVHTAKRTAERTSAARSEARSATTAVSVDTSRVAQTRTRTVRRADGTTEHTVTISRRNDAKTAAAVAVATARVEYIDRVKLVEHTRTIERRAVWAAGIAYGRGLDGRARYGTHVDRRIVGPLWATGAVDVPTRAATVGLRLEW